MKSVLYHNYEPNADLTDTSDEVTCFLDTIKYDVGDKILLVGNIGNLGNRLRMLGVYVTILENTHYEDICYSLVRNTNCTVVKGCLELLPFEEGYFDKVIILDYLNNTANYKNAIREISRVLKTDGEVILEDLNLKNIKVKLKNIKHKLCGEKICYRYPHEIISLFSEEDFNGSLKEIENERYIYIGKRK